MRRFLPTRFLATLGLWLVAGWVHAAVTLSPALEASLLEADANVQLGTVIVAFHGEGPLGAAELAVLQETGILGGLTLEELNMVAVEATVGQVLALADREAVRSVWDNEPLEYHLHEARVVGGVERVETDADLTFFNVGLPVSGRGNFSVVINDSGIDGTHDDLRFPGHVVENVQILSDTDLVSGFTPLLALEGQPNTDTHIGHGTHVAGIVGGTGQLSGRLYTGVAPGANLIGTGSGVGLFILNALGGFEWSLANQFRHRIRVINNSFGGRGDFNPDEPLHIASKRAADRNIAVVYSAGNSGPGVDTHNRLAKAPWVISVAAGTKEGGLAGFSSRGTPAWERLNDGNPLTDNDAPTITAPGTGRAFAENVGRLTARVVSARSSTNVVAQGGTNDTEIPPAFLPFYTQIHGTSMSAPFIAGVIALMLEADPTLSVAEIKQILIETATPMPGLIDHEVGAGFVDAHAAVTKVFERDRDFGALVDPAFNLGIESAPVAEPEFFEIEFSYLDSAANIHPFEVTADVGILHVRIDFGNTVVTDEGNVFFLVLTRPDGEELSFGPALPVLDPKHIEAVVQTPMPGSWQARVSAGFLLGLAPATVPERVDGTIKRFSLDAEPVVDIAGHADENTIRRMLLNRRMDVFADGGFHPDADVTRADFAFTLALNTPLRQRLDDQPKFADVDEDLRPFAEAVAARGPTLRDFDFINPPLIEAEASQFMPDQSVIRLDAAVALVRGLGLEPQAAAMAGSTVTVDGLPLVDNDQIPAQFRGHVQLALDRNVFEAFPAEVREIAPGQFIAIPGPRFEPDTLVTRAALARHLDRFTAAFATGF